MALVTIAEKTGKKPKQKLHKNSLCTFIYRYYWFREAWFVKSTQLIVHHSHATMRSMQITILDRSQNDFDPPFPSRLGPSAVVYTRAGALFVFLYLWHSVSFHSNSSLAILQQKFNVSYKSENRVPPVWLQSWLLSVRSISVAGHYFAFAISSIFNNISDIFFLFL
mgnify:CR=1 FL=1